VLAGAGMGLCITPLTSTVLAHATPETAGSISGALSTMQQVGNALGVAVTGAIFYGALDHGVATAFSRSLVELTGLLIGVAVLTKCLPGRPGQVAAAPPAPQRARQTAAQTAPAATGPAASTSPTTTKAA
jgi:MFS family permease